MKSNRLLAINLVLFAIAIIAACYSVWHHYALINGEAGKTFCAINATFDCDAVNTSKYSEILGVPMGTFAFAYYVFGFVLTLIALQYRYARREVLLVLAPFAAFGALMSVIMFSISAFALKTICLTCTVMQVVDIMTFILVLAPLSELISLRDYVVEAKKIPGRKIFVYFVGIGAVFILAHGFSSQLKKELPLDAALFAQEFRSQPVVNLDLAADDPSPKMGYQGAHPAVQMVEFSDFQCPHCALAASYMNYLLKRYGDKVQLVFKSFPLDQSCNPYIKWRMHDYSCLAAKAAFCSAKQGKFEEYHQQIYRNAKDINAETLRQWAREEGMNVEALETCMASEETRTALLHDMDLANRVGVSGTPVFFVNGKRVEGAIDEQRMRIILRELGVD